MRQRISKSKKSISAMTLWPFLVNVEFPHAQLDTPARLETLCSEATAALNRQRARLTTVGPARPYLRAGAALQVDLIRGDAFVQLDPHPMHADLVPMLCSAIAMALQDFPSEAGESV
jgi:hypothetical protein